ncbi:MAG: hypothetical protein HYV62_09345, partial [Candidatus Rokubacteria bacterium]|nr:hypothetical protein [Candidatus Rokubacteria bacterium]
MRLAGGNPILVHNVVLFATFPLVGLTMFFLVRHLTGHSGPATVAALLYAFSHYRFGHLSHINVLGHQWVPLMLLGLHLAVARRARWRDVTLATGAFVLQALSSGYYGAFSAVALAVFVLWVAAPAGRPPLGRLVLRGLIAGAVGALVLTPTVVPYYLVRRESGLIRELAETQLYSARLTSYLATPPGNLWFGAPTERFRRPEGELFPGAVMLGLAAVGIGAAWGRRGSTPAVGGPDRAAPAQPRVWPRWLDVVLAAYLVLTLANVLVLGGFGVTLGPIRVSQRHFERAALVAGAVLALRRLINRRAVPLAGLGWVRQLGWPNAAGHYVALVV